MIKYVSLNDNWVYSRRKRRCKCKMGKERIKSSNFEIEIINTNSQYILIF